ncbi:hypothetical protein PCCS19_24010 [Paenibacillus sp. CCS19]|uniref:DUF6382 domain-containing protein n=1 Tax=Paenibacillus sp. CCS19 TaxID=3158387 RepID=UPI00256E9456|nr:DUF6382 domain-containing protein [Paenibacillus cellulosilyticus]GMK39347.1 hypothetical protein PCCS19_24010 [Paenibacillus cellulosilyticus]
MGPFRVDFAMNRGHELILDREQPIAREELDTMELQMLRSNQVPFLLPVEWIEIDGCVTFRYSIAGRRMLSHQLQLQAMTMQQFYMFLLAITEALDACKSYLLRPECCMLDETYIFVGERWDDVSLLYVPFRNKEQSADELTAFIPLVMRLTAHVQQLDGAGLQSILKHVNDSRGVRPALIRTLLQLIGGENNEQQQSSVNHSLSQTMVGSGRREKLGEQLASNAAAIPLSVSSSAIFSNAIGRTYEREQEQEGTAFTPQMASYEQAGSGMQTPQLKLSTLEPEDEQTTSSEQQSRNKWLMIGGTAIGTALVWRYTYADHPTSDSLMLASGATLCLVSLLFILLRRQRANDILGESQTQLPDAAGNGDSSESGELQYWPDSQLLERRYAHSEPKRLESASSAEKRASDKELVPKQSAETSMLPSAAAATVWMGGNAAAQQSGVSDRMADNMKAPYPRWVVERAWKGKQEQYMLPGEDAGNAVFVIGRFSEKADIADDHPGISRVHVEFGRSEEGFTAKDMGSRNGTALNGNPMIAYKSYMLCNGDTLQLAGNAGPVYTIRQVG